MKVGGKRNEVYVTPNLKTEQATGKRKWPQQYTFWYWIATNCMRRPMVTEWRSKVILVQSLHRELRENKGTESLLCVGFV